MYYIITVSFLPSVVIPEQIIYHPVLTAKQRWSNGKAMRCTSYR